MWEGLERVQWSSAIQAEKYIPGESEGVGNQAGDQEQGLAQADTMGVKKRDSSGGGRPAGRRGYWRAQGLTGLWLETELEIRRVHGSGTQNEVDSPSLDEGILRRGAEQQIEEHLETYNSGSCYHL